MAGIDYIGSEQFLIDGRTSGIEFLSGFSLAIVVGIALGFAIAWFRRLEYFLDPIINFLYASPRIAIAPLLIIWFGIDMGSKVAIIFLMAVFPIIINTALGVRSVDHDLVELARSFNASHWQLLRTVVMPFSVPFIVTGVRIGMGVAFIGVVVGEFIASTAGIGFAIQQAASSFEVDMVFVGLVIVGVAGVLMTEALRHLEAKLARWKTR
jgi:NitT/TauT family transport system permease protein